MDPDATRPLIAPPTSPLRDKLLAHLRAQARTRLIDCRAFPNEERVLALAGYGLIGLLLGCVLLLQYVGRSLPAAVYHDGDHLVRSSVVAVALASAVFATGWAYLLAGSTTCAWPIRWTLLGIFLFEGLVLTAGAGPALFLFLGTLGVLVSLRIATRKRFCSHGARFFSRLLASGAAVLLLWGCARDYREVAGSVDAALLLPFLLLWPALILLGLQLLAAGLDLTRGVVRWLRGRLSERALRLTALAFLALAWILPAALVEASALTVTAITSAAALPLTLVVVILVALRRWNTRNAALVLALLLLTIPFGVSLAMVVTRLHQLDTAAPPPVFLFVLMLLWNVLEAGPRLVNGESRFAPREARAQLYFGLLLLLLAYALLRLDARDPQSGTLDKSVQVAVNSSFLVGLFVLGPFYVVWLACRRPERLLGPETGTGWKDG